MSDSFHRGFCCEKQVFERIETLHPASEMIKSTKGKDMKKESPNVILYLSPTTGSTKEVAPLNDKLFVQRLQDLTAALQSLNELQRALLGSKQVMNF